MKGVFFLIMTILVVTQEMACIIDDNINYTAYLNVMRAMNLEFLVPVL